MSKNTVTLTIRNVPLRVINALKEQARRRNRSMEQEVRDLLATHVGQHASVLRQIKASWDWQIRRPTAQEIDDWIESGRR